MEHSHYLCNIPLNYSQYVHFWIVRLGELLSSWMYFHYYFRQKIFQPTTRSVNGEFSFQQHVIVDRSSKCSSGFMWNRAKVFVSISLYIMDRIRIRTGANEDVFKEVCRLLFQSSFHLRANILKRLHPERSLMVLWDRWSPSHNYQRSSAHL